MRSNWTRRLIAGSMLAWLGMLQFPLPTPLRAPSGKDLSVPFPCMNRPCGCSSAEQCWKSCCCTTKEERLAFARQVLGYVPSALASADDKPSEDKPSCDEKQSCDGKPSCCQPKSCCQSKAEATKPVAKKAKSGTVVFSEVMKCRGLSAGFSIFSAAVPMPNTEYRIPAAVAVESAPILNLPIVRAPVIEPITPPPRVSVA